MSWKRLREGFLGIVAVAVIATAGAARAGDEDLKDSMGEALDALQPLLVALINSDYEAALRHVDPILGHASRLPRMIPDDAAERRDEYLAYTYNLTKNAAILKSFLIVLVNQDKTAKGQEGSKTEHFPIVAATHYGGVVDMCVTCHNAFRVAIEP